MAKSYYKTIDGNKYDRDMIEIVEAAAAGQGDEQISLEDAEKLYEAIIDGNTITQIKQESLAYIKETYKFTEAAEKWLNEELDSWTARKEAQEQKKVEQPLTETGEPVTVTTAVSEATPVQPIEPRNKLPLIWLILVVVLLILIPVSFFVGKSSAPAIDNPALTVKIDKLEKELQAHSQALAKSEAENDRLNNRPVKTVPKSVSQSNLVTSGSASTTQSGAREEIAASLTKIITNSKFSKKILFDSEKLLLTIHSDESLFGRGSTELGPGFAGLLSDFFPLFVKALRETKQEISGIQFQGHTSSYWKVGDEEADTYLENMKLSVARAQAALQFCLDLKRVAPNRTWLTQRLVSAGFSDSKPIVDQDNQEDQARSRRVSIAVNVD
jgi:flagellar motor protein MotB